MKDKFHGYYRPSEEYFANLWNDAIFAFDANTLLNLYTYSSQTRTKFLDILEELQDRIWLPYRAGLEYHRNRTGIIRKEIKKYGEIRKALRGVLQELSSTKRHPFIEEKTLASLERLTKKIERELRTGEKAHSDLVKEDPILERITFLFDKRIGERFTEEEESQITKEGVERYKKKIPPGYADEKREGLTLSETCSYGKRLPAKLVATQMA